MGELEEKIREFESTLADNLPADVLKVLRDGMTELVTSGIARHARQEGASFPAFALPNANGELVTLAELIAAGPVVINFYRGSWCPYCNLELEAYRGVMDEIKALGASFVAISPQLPDESLSARQRAALEFEVLTDQGNSLARELGLVFKLTPAVKAVYQQLNMNLENTNGDNSWELPMPATYVVNRQGLIVKAFVDGDYSKRLEPAEVLDCLKKI